MPEERERYRPVKLGSLFSGIGGAELAARAAGIETAWMVEKDPFAQKVLRYRFPGIPLFDDVQEVGAHNLEPVDVITAGWPCQDLSVAGKRAGLKGARSGLFHEAVRVIRELGPRYFVGENVPGLFSSGGGWDFAAVLDEMEESGALDIAWRVLDAQWFGVPQRRRRIFLVADFAGERAGEILSLSEGVQRHPAPGREAGQAVAALTSNGVGTCGADDNQGQAGHLLAYTRKPNGVAGGNPARYGKGTDSDATDTLVTHTLTSEGHDASEDGTGRGTPLVPAYALDPHITANGEKSHEGHSKGGPTAFGLSEELAFSHRAERTQAIAFAQLTTGGGKPEPVGFHTTQDPIHVEDGSPCLGQGTKNGFGATGVLTTGGGKPGQGYPAVAFALDPYASTNSEQSHAAHAKGGPRALGIGEDNLAFSHRAERTQSVAQGMAVRRLTPLEAERLQGFPDGWTDIPGASDSARYRALGNAWAVPCGAWVMQGITGRKP